MTARCSRLYLHPRPARRFAALKTLLLLPGLALYLALGLTLCLALTTPAAAAIRSHGLSAFGELKYPKDFKHFDYVNPDAPKGGKLSMIGTAGLKSFDSFNAFILKGDAAQGLSFLFDTLMTRADDEPDAVYSLVAKWAEVADDKLSVTFGLREEAKFSDGTPVRAEDVKFSFDILKKKGHPSYRISMRNVVRAEILDPLTIRYVFKGKLVRDLPLIVAGLPILSKAYYKTRDFAKTTLEPPLGSGPYRLSKFSQGSFVEYTLRDDYWARDLPVNRGRFNFRILRYEYFRERAAELINLKNGTYDLREEFTSKDWATAYNIPQVKDGRIIRLTLPDERIGGAQGFFINTRRGKFSDVRVRRALDMAFDFEWTNKNLFYKLYKRTQSIFENSDMKAHGKPTADELKLLEPFRDKLPAEVFGEPYTPPVSDGSGKDRKLLRRAIALMKSAGWNLRRTSNGLKMLNGRGETLDIEFLLYEKSFERIIGPYVRNLKAIGINASIRVIDSAQFERRVKSFDFDIIVQRFIISSTPGPELNSYFSSKVANVEGSFNLAGVRDPVVDALIDKVIAATSRKELVTAARALDRVLRAGNYWVPHWYKAAHNIAHWNKFSRPKIKPKYARGVIDTWWYDEAKAAKLKK